MSAVCRTDPNGDHTTCHPEAPEETYEYQLAKLFRDGNEFTGNVGLDPKLKIYVEHSNEVWNYGFRQHAINQNIADFEVSNGSLYPSMKKSNLASAVPGREDIDARQHCTNTSGVVNPKTGESTLVGSACWSRRRHARRVYEISRTFQSVFGEGSLATHSNPNGRVRMVYASWGLESMFQNYYNDTLSWLEAEYGPVSDYLYAISYAQYFAPSGCNDGHCEGGGSGFNYSTASLPQVIDGFHNGTKLGIPVTMQFVKFAKSLQVKTMSYEGGPGYHVGAEKPGSSGLNLMIEGSRLPGMKAVVIDHVDTCWQYGWDS